MVGDDFQRGEAAGSGWKRKQAVVCAYAGVEGDGANKFEQVGSILTTGEIRGCSVSEKSRNQP